MIQNIVRAFVVSLSLLAAIGARAATLGVDRIPSGEAVWLEGTIRVIAYAPGTTQTLSNTGSWHVIHGPKGTLVSIAFGAARREVALIGNDQFELSTLKQGVQEGEIRARQFQNSRPRREHQTRALPLETHRGNGG